MPRILIVEDESFRETAAMEFRLKGWEVETASDGSIALDCLSKDPSRFDGIVLDLKMPKVPGAEVLRTLTRRGLLADICVVVLTGNYSESQDLMRDSIRRGAWHFLQKPASVDELIKVMAPGIAMKHCHRMRRQLVAGSVEGLLRSLGEVMSATLRAERCHLVYVEQDRTLELNTLKDLPHDPDRRFVNEIVSGNPYVFARDEAETKALEPINPDSKSLMAVAVVVDGAPPTNVLEVECSDEVTIDESWRKVLDYIADLISFAELRERAMAGTKAEKVSLMYQELRHRIGGAANVVSIKARELQNNPKAVAVRGDIDQIVRHSAQIIGVVEDLRVLADTSDEAPKAKQQRDLAVEASHQIQALAESAKRVYAIDIVKETPELGMAVEVDSRIGYCIDVYLENAMDAILERRQQDPDCPLRGTIKVRCSRRDNGRIGVVVEDDGIGVPERLMESLYLPMFTTKKPKPSENQPGRVERFVRKRELVYHISIVPPETTGELNEPVERVPPEVRLARGADGNMLISVTEPAEDLNTALASCQRRGGVGIGLFSVKRIVEANGGAVEPTLSQGDFRGSTFGFWLPASATQI